MRRVVWIVGLLLAGCAPNLEHLKPIAEALAKDQASACIAVWVGVGGGAVVPVPVVPTAGGWGYVFLGRTNQPGSSVHVTNAECWIEHGGAPGE